MKEKSLRQISREIGVSHQYLSQILNGKRPMPKEYRNVLLSLKNGKQKTQNGKQQFVSNDIITTHFRHGEVSELADEHDLGSCAARLGGSSPPFPTKGIHRQNYLILSFVSWRHW